MLSTLNIKYVLKQRLATLKHLMETSKIMKDTLRAPPPEKITMKKVSIMTVCITTFFYLCCGGFGYAAFGNSTPGNLLTGFGFYEPYWLVDFANACVVLHLVGGYQVLLQFYQGVLSSLTMLPHAFTLKTVTPTI